jgi:hypothetical protein
VSKGVPDRQPRFQVNSVQVQSHVFGESCHSFSEIFPPLARDVI